MATDITGIITWLKGWFFDKDEITAKEQALQTQINNKASTSDLNTTNSNVTNLQNNKANKTNGVAQITDSKLEIIPILVIYQMELHSKQLMLQLIQKWVL